MIFMMREKITGLLLSTLMLFSLFSVMPMTEASAAVTYGTRVPITKTAQVVDSITFNGTTVNSIYAPRKQINNYDSDSTYCCAAFVSRFYREAFGIGINGLYPDSSKPKPNIYSGKGSFSLTTTPRVGDIAANSHHWAIVKNVSGNEITLIEQNVWTDNYTKALIGNKIILPESNYWFWHYSENTTGSSDEPHTHNYTYNVVEPTYTELGYTVKSCAVCGDYYRTSVQPRQTMPAVTGFKISALTTNSVKLTWDNLDGVEGYVVYQYDPANKSWIRLAKTKANTFTSTKLLSGTSYKFAVKPYVTIDGKESGGPKLTQLFTSTNPDKVSFNVTSSSVGRADFKWSKVRGATGYIVYYKASANDVWHRFTVTSGTSFTKTGLKRGNTYTFTVKAYRTTGGVTYNGAFTPKNLKIK